MIKRHLGIIIVVLLLAAAAAFVALRAWSASRTSDVQNGVRGGGTVAVEIAPIQSGRMQEVRILSGSLEARARFTVAAKVNGLLEALLVDIGDTVQRGQMVAEIDDAEFVQSVAQAEAELAVRKAEMARAVSAHQLAQRDYDRALALQERGIASEAQVDETSAALQSAAAESELARARVQQAEASLKLAGIHLEYANVKAEWTGGPATATVSQRHLDSGDSVRAGDPIVSIAALDPLTAVVSVTESDYARLNIGQPAALTTDAMPGRTFESEVVRIAPIFRETSRQARVELEVKNPDRLLRPGMFIRLRVVLGETDAPAIVPLAAILERDGQRVIYIVGADGKTARKVPVELGVTQGDRVQITSPEVAGSVVVLGQQLLEEGSSITIIDNHETSAGTGG